jgi:hypothetical protein
MGMDGVKKTINVCFEGPDRQKEQNTHTECLASYSFVMHVLVTMRLYTELELYCYGVNIHQYICKLMIFI